MYKGKISKEKVKQVQDLVAGLTQSQWGLIRAAVDFAYSQKSNKVTFDSSEEIGIINSFLKL